MKRLLAIIFITSLLLYACGGNGAQSTTSAGPESEQTHLPDETPGPQSLPESTAGESAEASDEASAEASDEASAEASDEASDGISEEISAEPYVRKPADRSGRRISVSEGCRYTAFGSKHGQYGDDGKKLTDGVIGGEVGWGWETGTGRFVLDLGTYTEDITDFNMYLRGGNWGIKAPDKAEYFISADGKKWESAGTVSGDGVISNPSDETWMEYSFPLALDETVAARYVRFDLSGGGMNYAWMHEICVWKYVEAAPVAMHEFAGTESFDNTSFTNPGQMGDADGPAYCVYSRKGYNKAEMSFELSAAEASILGKRGALMNGYVFLGATAFNEGGYWVNSCDAGLTYTGENGGWRLFWNTANDGTGNRGWFSGGKTLDDSRNYRITLDCSQKDGWALVTVTDIDDCRVVDSAEFRFPGSKADGSNLELLTDIAVDWASEETWVDSHGEPTEDWTEVVFACAGQNMYFKNLRIYDCALYNGDLRFEWEPACTDRRGLCPDAGTEVYGTVITVHSITGETEYIVDIDLG
ncbi:MAG: hypothetical protein J6252_01890 [Clostridia bacterium]|nr:hypothetical protein [Clostridia bacterium]